MAIITLDSGEAFEHYHTGNSQTVHLDGKIQLCFNEENRLLEKGEKVEIPANTSHTIVNLGDRQAKVACHHK